MNLVISIVISMIISMFVIIPFIRKYLKEKKNIKNFLKDNKYELLCILLIIFGILCRLLFLDKVPSHFNQDEASIGYEAYSILNYGIDRNGISYPVHFVSWGSGQNVLYAYILIPFIKLLGLNIFSVRLPMALIGCISILVLYKLLKLNFKEYSKKFVIATLIITFFPYMFLKSRWALESNIFPDLILYATFLLNKYLKNKKSRYLYIASIFIGVSVYSYGTSYIFLPVYCLTLSIYLLKKRYVKIKDIVICSILIGIIVFPMILFTIINYFYLDTINIGKITIPKMVISRLHETNIKNGSILQNIISNIVANIFIIFSQFDGVKLNYTMLSVIINIVLSIFFFMYFIKYRKEEKKSTLDELMYVFLIASTFTVTFFSFRVIMSVNRVNIILIPYLYFAIKSIMKIDFKYTKVLVLFIFVFVIEYFTIYNYNLKNNSNVENYAKAIEYVQSINESNKVYIDNNVTKEAYIYYLFYTKLNPSYYINNVEKEVKIGKNFAAEKVNRIGNVYFYLPEKQDGIIITTKDKLNKNYNMNINIKEFGDVVVLY